MANESVMLCVQRVLHSENADYDDAVSGVTRHYVRIAQDSGPLATAVQAFIDDGIHLVDVSAPMEFDNPELCVHAKSLKHMLVSALKGREEGCPTKASVKMLRQGVVPLLVM